MKLVVSEVTAREEIEACYPVMTQLRPHLTDCAVFVERVERQVAAGYRLVFVQEEGRVCAVAGFRFMELLAWGKVLYVDDLITDAEMRNKGHAGVLLKWLIELAREEGCDEVHLDSGPHRHDAHRLYLNHRFKIVAHHFALGLK